jgi:hypothetical protein
MKTPTQIPTVTSITLPMISYGFRSGYARAMVNGRLHRLHTSKSQHVDYDEHMADVRALFEAGKGEPITTPVEP